MFLFTVSYAVFLSLFLEFCFRERNIFGWWLPFVARTWLGSKEALCTHEWTQGNMEDSLDDFLIEKAHWVTYPLGACVVCLGFWVTAVILIPYIYYLSQPFWILVVVYTFGILFSSFLIRLLHGRLL